MNFIRSDPEQESDKVCFYRVRSGSSFPLGLVPDPGHLTPDPEPSEKAKKIMLHDMYLLWLKKQNNTHFYIV